MKFIAIFIFLTVTKVLFSQASIVDKNFNIDPKEWNNETVLTKLFHGTYIDSLQSIKWQAFSGEVIEKSYDGFCYTTVDSVYTFKNDSLIYKVVVLKTSSYSDESLSGLSNADASTMGIAMFSEENNGWKLLCLNRSVILTGHGGYLGEIEIVDLGNNLMVLSLIESEHHEIDTHNYLFNLNTINFGLNVFSYKTFHRIVDFNEDVYKFEFSEIQITKAKTEESFPKIELTKKRTTIKDDIELTESLSTTILEYNGYGFY